MDEFMEMNIWLSLGIVILPISNDKKQLIGKYSVI